MSNQNDRRNPDEIESDIYQTRSHLDDTLHEIEQRFSPQQLMNTTMDYIRQGGANDFMTNLGRTVKQNPLPIMLTGVGLGWLMLSQRKPSSGSDYRSSSYDTGYPTTSSPAASASIPATSHTPPTSQSTATTRAATTATGAGTTSTGAGPASVGASTTSSPTTSSPATPHVSSPADPHVSGDTSGHGNDQGRMAAMKGKAQKMTGKAQEMTGKLKGRAQHMGDNMRNRTSQAQGSSQSAMRNMSYRAQGMGEQTTHFIQDHPLVAGALGVAIGAAIGSLIPSTRVENERLGEYRDKAMHKAAEAGQQQADRAQAKVHEKAEEAKSNSPASSNTSGTPSMGASGATSSTGTSGTSGTSGLGGSATTTSTKPVGGSTTKPGGENPPTRGV